MGSVTNTVSEASRPYGRARAEQRACVHMQSNGHTPEWSGPKVERLMRNGKRVYVPAFKTWLVDQASKPGVSVAGLALHNGVNANQLRGWMRLPHLSAASAALPTLLPVTITHESLPSAPADVPVRAASNIEIELGGAVVRVPSGVDERQLRMILDALR